MPAYAGFDAYDHPGDDVLAWLSSKTNLEWCGYYLAPAPSRKHSTWMGSLVGLKAAGWGVAPIYVGEQVTGPGSLNPSAGKGTLDGQHAAELMTSEGFAPNSCVYLDLENGLPFPHALQDYTKAWCHAVEDAGYKPGVYCSHSLAAQVHGLYPRARVWAFKVATVDPTPYAHPFPVPEPSGCGYQTAFAWQLAQYAQLAVALEAEEILSADLSSSLSQDPGAPLDPTG